MNNDTQSLLRKFQRTANKLIEELQREEQEEKRRHETDQVEGERLWRARQAKLAAAGGNFPYEIKAFVTHR